MPIEITGLDAIVKKLEALDDPKVFRDPMKLSVNHLHNKIADTPTGNQHRKQPFKTDKSRRYFFWALKKGDIEVPYRRGMSPNSEKLTTSWTTSVSADGRTGKVGNDTSYGRLVQDKTRQTSYHKTTGWKTTQDVAKKEEATIVGFFKAALDRAVNK